MTQQEFLTINIPIVKERRSIAYKLYDGVIITFLNNKNKYNLLLNGHEVERGQNYSDWAIRNSFLSIKNNMRSFQLYPFSDGKTYAIQRDIELPHKLNWNNVIIVEDMQNNMF